MIISMLALSLAQPAVAGDASISARAATPDVQVFVSDQLLCTSDKLSDGGYTKLAIPETLLYTWVDLEPGAKFTHDTWYVFAGESGKAWDASGGWWPELNGSVHLYGDEYKVEFPVEITLTDSVALQPLAYVYPKPLSTDDKLSDGGYTDIELTDTTFLMWIDTDPDARFTHDTWYVLVSADGDVRVEEGGWWPVLNGSTILYGSKPVTVEFPFDLVAE